MSAAGREGPGARVRRAQIALTVFALRNRMDHVWPSTENLIRRYMIEAGFSAHQAEAALRGVLLSAVDADVSALERSMRAQALATVENLISRGENGIPLSAQVWRSRALQRRLLDRTIDRALLLGKSWKELADDVRDFANPNAPGGLSYVTKRLARTEISNAFHRTQIRQHEEEPWTRGMRWNLSGSHPKKDVCNEYAEKTTSRSLGRGVYPSTDVPRKPHPQCLCYLTAVTVDLDTFIRNYQRGRYTEYMNRTMAERNAQSRLLAG